MLDAKTKYHINPTGRFVIGGPMGDAGLTGRKIIVDTYGGMARHGGCAVSRQNPIQVDRLAADAMRLVGKEAGPARVASPVAGAWEQANSKASARWVVA